MPLDFWGHSAILTDVSPLQTNRSSLHTTDSHPASKHGLNWPRVTSATGSQLSPTPLGLFRGRRHILWENRDRNSSTKWGEGLWIPSKYPPSTDPPTAQRSSPSPRIPVKAPERLKKPVTAVNGCAEV
jgi:hypothetical protein